MGSTCFTSTHVDAHHANPLELRRWLLPDIVIIHLCATLHIVHGRLTVILTSLQHTNMEHLPSLNCHVGALFSCIVWWNTWHWLSFAWQQMSVIDVGWVQQLHPYKKYPAESVQNLVASVRLSHKKPSMWACFVIVVIIDIMDIIDTIDIPTVLVWIPQLRQTTPLRVGARLDWEIFLTVWSLFRLPCQKVGLFIKHTLVDPHRRGPLGIIF